MSECTYIYIKTQIIKSFICISIFINTFNLTFINAYIYITYIIIIIIAKHKP